MAKGKRKKKERHAPDVERKGAIISLVTEYEFLIVILVTALVLFGVTMVFSAGYYQTVSQADPDPYYYLKRQGFFAATGTILMYIAAKLDYHIYKKLWPIIAGASLVLLILVLTPVGETVNGAARYIPILGIRITPSEISKLSMILFTSVFIAEDPTRIRRFFSGILPLFLIMGLHAVLILRQPNLSTAVVVCAIMFGIMIVAGLRMWYTGAAAGVLAAGAFYILTMLPKTHHWYRRLTNFIDPFADAQGEGYQVSQSLIALGNGGLKGLGLGNSISKNLYLPEPQNDFILAVIGEELGFIGVAILMIVYLVLIWRIFIVAANAKDKLGLFIAAGVAIMLGLQVIINVAVVTASMPATGITLPFISYGGTSLWIFMTSMGIVLNISHKREETL